MTRLPRPARASALPLRSRRDASLVFGKAGEAVAALLLGIFVASCGRPPEPGALTLPPVHAEPPALPPSGRAVIESLEFPPLEFTPPVPERFRLANGAAVFYLEDRSLPLVDVQARFRGGASNFPRELYGAATALAGLLRTGGTGSLAPDSVDQLVDYHAWDISFGSGGRSSFGSFGSLTEHVGQGLRLFADMILRPRFDPERVEVWRGQELESVRRRKDSPGFHAATEFNRLMYGEHPVGWVLEEEDLEAVDLTRGNLRRVHAAIYCPERAIFGVTGDIALDDARRLLDEAFRDWPPCSGDLSDPPPADVRDEGGVFVLARPVEQSTVYMAHGTELTQGPTGEYFASRIANAILGGSGFTSRLVREVRTRRGLAYGAGSFWTTPLEPEGVFGVTTATRAEATVEAVRVMRDVLRTMREEPPADDEVRLAVDDIVNGFVFNFERPSQIVGRQMLYYQEELPADWLERYLEGVQRVTPADVVRVIRDHIHPERLTIFILGDVAAMDPPPSTLGEVTELRASSR